MSDLARAYEIHRRILRIIANPPERLVDGAGELTPWFARRTIEDVRRWYDAKMEAKP